MIPVVCPNCRSAISIPESEATLPVFCTACGSGFAVGIPITAPATEWVAPEPDSQSLPLRFQQKQRLTARGPGVFPIMALLFALFVPFGIGAILYTATQKPRTRPSAVPSEERDGDPLAPAEAGERKAAGGLPIVEYKSLTEDPALLVESRLETALPAPKAEAAPPLFRSEKPGPPPGLRDRVSTPKPPPP